MAILFLQDRIQFWMKPRLWLSTPSPQSPDGDWGGSGDLWKERIESPRPRAQDIRQHCGHPSYNVMTPDCDLINLIAYDQRARYKTCVLEYRIVTSTALVLSTTADP
jgi:hypothetical protein